MTPTILGRSFILTPIVVILGLLLWGWIWGVAGALIAVPMLVAGSVICVKTPALQPVFQLLSGVPEGTLGKSAL